LRRLPAGGPLRGRPGRRPVQPGPEAGAGGSSPPADRNGPAGLRLVGPGLALRHDRLLRVRPPAGPRRDDAGAGPGSAHGAAPSRPGPARRAVGGRALVWASAVVGSFVSAPPLGSGGMMLALDLHLPTAIGADLVFWPGDVIKNVLATAVAATVIRAFPALA